MNSDFHTSNWRASILTDAYLDDWCLRECISKEARVITQKEGLEEDPIKGGVGGEGGRRSKVTIPICSQSICHCSHIEIYAAIDSNRGNVTLSFHPCTVNIFISFEAFRRSHSLIAFSVIKNNLHWCKMKHEVNSCSIDTSGFLLSNLFTPLVPVWSATNHYYQIHHSPVLLQLIN